MSLPVRIQHPAFVTFTPQRGRNPRRRSVLSSVETFIPEAAASDFEPYGELGPPLLRGQDALWSVMEGIDADGRWGLACPAWLAEKLACNGADPGADNVGWTFKGTPIRARSPQPMHEGTETVFRQGRPDIPERVDLDGVRAIHDDGRAAAAAAVRAYVASDLRILGDRVLRRSRPVATVYSGERRRGTPSARGGTPIPAGVAIGEGQHPEWYDAFPARPSTLMAALERLPPERRIGPDDASPTWRLIQAWSGLGDVVAGARDGALLVDWHVESVAGLLRELVAIQRRGTRPRAVLEGALDRLAPHVEAALTGTPEDSVGDALAAMSAGLAVLDANPPSTDYHWDRAHLRRWVDGFYRPRHEGLPEADADSLAALGPAR